MSRRELTRSELGDALASLPEWEVVEGKLHRTFRFGSFAEAIGWMVSVAVYADRIGHHPEWSNVYRDVTVNLITHDMNALSTLDVLLAERMEMLACLPS